MTAPGQHSVFTITGGADFLHRLARGILERHGTDPDALAGIRVLLPNRRACAALGDAFLRELSGRPTLLPEISPIGDIDDSDFLGEEDPAPGGPADLPPAIPPLRRRLLLARMVMARDRGLRPAHALRLADGLARLLDEAQTERLDFSALADLVPEELAEHWQDTLRFLEIVTENWPQILADRGCMDPVDRRNRLTAARVAEWRERPPPGPVIAAGSTGTIPATADLLACVAAMEGGAVVLPGLDRTLDPASIEALGPAHPQFGMTRLVRERLELEIADIPDWCEGQPGPERRQALIGAALRPPATAAGAFLPAAAAETLAGVRRIACPGLQQEARVIALMMREALEIPDRTAALITPDRGLARRVAAELGRWRIEIDDSGGAPLAATFPGAFLRVTAEAVASDAAPVPLLAALKHPLAAAGDDPARFRRHVRLIERAVLRGPRPEPGFAGLGRAIAESPAIADGGLRSELAALVDRLGTMAEPFAAALSVPEAAAGELLDAHVGFAEALAATDRQSGAERLWAQPAGEQASLLVAELRAAAADFPAMAGAEWPAVLDSAIDRTVVRLPYGLHPRLNIWGLLEARLQHADLVIMGGLNEGAWPPGPAPDPWMSRPMRADFGLQPPERHIGLTAHDFVQGFGAREVVLTRSTRVDGSPTVPARWLARLETLLSSTETGSAILDGWQAEEGKWLRWQADLDGRLPRDARPAPAPRPPVAARPDRLSVTEIETLIRDPYAVYARHVLGLRALDPLDAAPGAADRGTIIHAAIERFLRTAAELPPEDPLALLIEIGREEFEEFLDRPAVRAFWWPRFGRIAAWIVEQERERAPLIAASHVELKGEMTIPRGAGPFLLTGRADRIDAFTGGGYAIIDYKTGAVPSKRDVNSGLAPQLPLEAAMIADGAFAGIPAGEVSELSYWKLSGGDPVGEIRDAGDDPRVLAQVAYDGLRKLLERYDDPGVPYRAQPDPDLAPRRSDYEHLERVQEWSASGEAE